MNLTMLEQAFAIERRETLASVTLDHLHALVEEIYHLQMQNGMLRRAIENMVKQASTNLTEQDYKDEMSAKDAAARAEVTL